MKQGLSTKELVLSLIFPVIILLFALVLFAQICMGYLSFEIWCAIAALCGGVLSIVLTVITKTDTSRFLTVRFAELFVSMVVFVGSFYISNAAGNMFYFTVIPAAVFIMTVVYYIRKSTVRTEWIIILLSNPYIYFILFFILFVIELNNAGYKIGIG